MKNILVNTLITIVAVFASIYVMWLLNDRREKRRNSNAAASPDAVAREVDNSEHYRKAKPTVILYMGNDQNPLEVEILQRWINLIPGFSVEVNGLFDQNMADVITKITGKNATSLTEFKNVYLHSFRLIDEANAIANIA